MNSGVRLLRAIGTTAAVVLALVAAQPASAATEVVTDGGFEAGVPSPHWTDVSVVNGHSGCDTSVSICGDGGGTAGPKSGTRWIWFGGTGAAAETAHVSQDVTVPAGRAATLSFWLWIGIPGPAATLRVSLDGTELRTFVGDAGGAYGSYAKVEIPLPGSTFDGTAKTLRFDYVTPAGSGNSNYSIDDVSLTYENEADAAVTLSPASGSVRVGDEVTYVVGLSNAGPTTASVSLSGVVPPELELVWSGGLSLSCSDSAGPGDELSCGPITLPSGASVYAQLRFRAVAPGTANLALTSAVAAPAIDPDPSDDTATATLEIEPVADLAATIDAPADATAGTPFDVTVGARNDGPSDASDVTLTTALPAGTTVVDPPADCAVAGPTVTCDLGTLVDGDDADRTLRVLPSQTGAVLLQTTVAGAAHDPEPANDQAGATVTVAAAPEPEPVDPAPRPSIDDPPLPPAPEPRVTSPEPPLAPVCLSERRFSTRLLRGRRGPGLRIPAAPSRARIVSARLSGPNAWKARRAEHARSRVDVDLRGAPAGRYTLRVRVRIAAAGRTKARTVTVTRTYRTCTPGR